MITDYKKRDFLFWKQFTKTRCFKHVLKIFLDIYDGWNSDLNVDPNSEYGVIYYCRLDIKGKILEWQEFNPIGKGEMHVQLTWNWTNDWSIRY